MARIILTALAALLISGAAAAQERTVSPNAEGAGKSGTGANSSQGSSGDTDEYSSHRAFGDANANPSAAVNRGDIDENSVQPLLQSKGYHDVRDLKRTGDVYTATAYKDKQVVRVNVDAHSGKITDTKLQ